MNKLTEFTKLRNFFDEIGLNYTYEENMHTNQMKVFVEDLYVWDVIDLKCENFIELQCHCAYNVDEVYSFPSAKEFLRYILQRFCLQAW